MANGLVTAYVDARTTCVQVSRALYRMSAELLGEVSKRIHDATTALLASAADAEFDDLPAVTFTLLAAMLAAMSGAIRIALGCIAAPPMLRALRTRLTMMCRTHLQAAATENAAGPVRRAARSRHTIAPVDRLPLAALRRSSI